MVHGSGREHDWEKNREQIKKQTINFLAREFATPNWRAISAETVGLAEITYPGLDSVEPPAKFIGDLPKEEMRQAMRACWPSLLHDLCDTLRIEGVITLGDRQTDLAYQSGGVPIGRWCAKHDVGYYGLLRFVGVGPEQRRRRFAATLLEACGMSKEDASRCGKELLEAAFDQLFGYAGPIGQTPTSPGGLA